MIMPVNRDSAMISNRTGGQSQVAHSCTPIELPSSRLRSGSTQAKENVQEQSRDIAKIPGNTERSHTNPFDQQLLQAIGNSSIHSNRNDFLNLKASPDGTSGYPADSALLWKDLDYPFGAETQTGCDDKAEGEAIIVPDKYDASQVQAVNEPFLDDALIDKTAQAMVGRGELEFSEEGDLFGLDFGNW